jgi:hypothetical protein
MPEQGRIRTGNQVETASGKMRANKLESFRFTSHDEAAISQIADKYGGEARLWKGAPGRAKQWEVLTPLARIGVVLPPDCLGDGITYEHWGGGYCLRRCDGEVCAQPSMTSEGAEMGEGPCVCATEPGPALCKAKLRLTVILRDIPFGGGWRLETTSENAVRELPGMVDLIHSLQEKQGLSSAVLVLDQRTKHAVVKGKVQTRHFGVPMLAVNHSLDEIQEGRAQLGAYSEAPQLAPTSVVASDEVEEAEIIVDTPLLKECEALTDQIVDDWNDAHPEEPYSVRQVLSSLAAQLTNDPTQNVAGLSQAHGEKLQKLLVSMTEGTVQFMGIHDGRVKVLKQ